MEPPTTTTTTKTVRLYHKSLPLVLLTLFLGLASITFSQSSGSLRGKVLFESHDGDDVGPGHAGHEPEYESLPGAYVRWSKDATHVEVTDGFGFFKISGGVLGDTLLVSMVGYQMAGLVYTGQSYVDIPLEPGVELGSAEVSAKKSALSISLLDPLNIQSLNRKELAKAACCNLSEAFETNASVDASFTDAVTGTRQIRMLGLDGKYSQIQVDNLPGPRGLNVIQGLMFIPGDWVNEIHISKGAGTVTQGYESMTGQINVALKNPETAEPLHLNIYTNSGGRVEFNHVSKHAISRRWSTAILGHALMNNTLNDRNEDGFLDNPLKRNFIGRNEWKFLGDRGIRGEYAVNYAQTESAGGQTLSYGSAADWPAIRDMMTTYDTASWSAITNIDRLEFTAKTGFVFPDAEWRSIGTQWSFSDHQHRQRFGESKYTGKERFFRGNVLYSDIFGNTNHAFTTGLSFVSDEFDETVQQPSDTVASLYDRHEIVPGGFFEYTWTHAERLSLVAGLRYDHHNMFGGIWSPRLHARWSATENTSIKVAAGRGFRTANPFVEQQGAWASQRTWTGLDAVYESLQPEIATNVGVNLTSKFRLNFRDASLAVDAYNTWFENKLVVDFDQSVNELQLYNLNGESFARSLQAEFNWDMHRRWDMRLAYRWVDAHTFRINGKPSRDPYVSTHRAFSQWSYATATEESGAQWRGDATVQWVGSMRLPLTGNNPEVFQRDEYSPDFLQVNLQITRQFSSALSIYLGVENLLNYKQDQPIVGAEYGDNSVTQAEFDAVFDASMIYGPIFGRMSYVGLRWGIPSPSAK